MRKKIFAGNWKMHMGPAQAKAFAHDFSSLISPNPGAEWILIPPFVSLAAMAPLNTNGLFKLGGQNCHFEPQGAFTGEISVSMLKEVGATYCLVGHSERRQYFGETNETCAKKVLAVAQGGLTPILCVGETQKERDEGKTTEVLKDQVTASLGLWSKNLPLVIAYEPVWAIGTGKVATSQQAEEAHVEIRKIMTANFGPDVSSSIQILYGGSVKPENSRELAVFPNIDGFLVGGASLNPKTFAQIGHMPL